MNKALLFKEWIKTRWMFLLMFVVFILAMGYIALRISSAARNVGMPHLWEVFILKNVVLLDQIKVLPLLAGIIMGITQFIPEMTKKRFKLTLHLPLGENRIVFLMLSYGMACLLLLFTVSYGGFLWGLSADFPREGSYRSVLCNRKTDRLHLRRRCTPDEYPGTGVGEERESSC